MVYITETIIFGIATSLQQGENAKALLIVRGAGRKGNDEGGQICLTV